MSEVDNEFAVEETSQNYDEPIPVAVSNPKKGFKIDRSSIKFFIISMVVFVAIYFVANLFKVKKQDFVPGKTDVRIEKQKEPKFADPLDIGEIDQTEKALMKKDLNRLNHDSEVDVVVPSSTLLIDEPPPVIENKNASMQRKRSLYSQSSDAKDSIRVSKAYLKKIEGELNKISKDVEDGSLFGLHEASYEYIKSENGKPVISENGINAYDDNRTKYPFPIDYLKVIPSVMILGHNSDLGNEMIAEILTGPYRGARLYGNVTTSRYVEEAYMKFNIMVYENSRYEIEALAVDQNTNIPAVPGKVKKHLAHNIVYGFGIGFLQAFAESRKFDAIAGTSGVNIPGLGNVGATINDSGALLESRALDAASNTLASLGAYRAPTYTKKAYKSIGIVFIPAGFENAVESPEKENK